MSAVILRLAKRLGVDPDGLVKKYPPDTVERTKYPVLETVAEDGTVTYRHDLGIEEGRRGEIRP